MKKLLSVFCCLVFLLFSMNISPAIGLPTVEITSPIDGEEIEIPHGGSVTITENDKKIISCAYQIDDDAQVSFNCKKGEFSINSISCDWHMLTIYVWEEGGDLTLESASFKVIKCNPLLEDTSLEIIPPNNTP